jgi:hypothetical protein
MLYLTADLPLLFTAFGQHPFDSFGSLRLYTLLRIFSSVLHFFRPVLLSLRLASYRIFQFLLFLPVSECNLLNPCGFPLKLCFRLSSVRIGFHLLQLPDGSVCSSQPLPASASLVIDFQVFLPAWLLALPSDHLGLTLLLALSCLSVFQSASGFSFLDFHLRLLSIFAHSFLCASPPSF